MRYKLLITLSLLSLSAMAQHSGKVKLLNGTVLKSANLRLDSLGDIIVNITPHEELTIPRETVFKARGRGFKYFGEVPDHSGWYGTAQAGLMFGRASENSGLRAGVALEAGAGYALNNMIRFGAGAGIQFIEDQQMVPIFFRFEGSMTNTRVAPIYSLDMGGAIAWYHDEFLNQTGSVDGGWLLRPGLGLRINNRTSGVYFLVNYQIQGLKYTSTRNWNWWGDFADYVMEEKRVMRNLNYTIGFSF